jgi:nitrile hydratase accessory protein
MSGSEHRPGENARPSRSGERAGTPRERARASRTVEHPRAAPPTGDPDMPPSLAHSPGIPRHPDGPVFRAPWEAQAFALTLALYERGAFTWTEWAGALSREIRAAETRGESGDGARYYEHWLAALENLAVAKELVSVIEILRRKDDWDVCARTTPHGRPIVLVRGAAADRR